MDLLVSIEVISQEILSFKRNINLQMIRKYGHGGWDRSLTCLQLLVLFFQDTILKQQLRLSIISYLCFTFTLFLYLLILIHILFNLHCSSKGKEETLKHPKLTKFMGLFDMKFRKKPTHKNNFYHTFLLLFYKKNVHNII